MTRFERWQKNRMSKQIALANEELGETAVQDHQRELLDKFHQQQLEMMLRVPPPPPALFR